MRYLNICLVILLANSCQGKSATEQQAEIAEEPIESVEVSQVPRVTTMPDFTQYADVREKKQAFFDFLRPMVEEENARILAERSRIITIYDSYAATQTFTPEDTTWLIAIAKQMKIKNFDIANANQRSALLTKKDIIPASLFLAQAANESGWGTSRFAREANNLFGQWCFTPGCGIVPSKRIPGEYHEIKKFETVNDAVNSYVRNINRHHAYRELRALREEMRNRGEVPTGEQLAAGLKRYSQRGEEYVKEIQSMIRVNKLDIAE
ncbi:MAG: glucosaminidase domain-containing protein [Cyclobacteriaceae bacterium]